MRGYTKFMDSGNLCPYWNDRPWNLRYGEGYIDPERYFKALALGCRRSGSSLYTTACPSCAQCIPLRIDISAYTSPKWLGRELDPQLKLDLRFQDKPQGEAWFPLYIAHRKTRDYGFQGITLDEFRQQLAPPSWAQQRALELYLGTQLVAVDVFDLVGDAVSSVVGFHHPDHRRLSLGHRALDALASWGRDRGLHYLYPGSYIQGLASMEFKGRFQPCEVRIDNDWVPLDQDTRRRIALMAGGSA